MEKVDEFIVHSYEKILIYLNNMWNNAIESVQNFDFVILIKIGFVLFLGYILAVIFSKYIPRGIKSFLAKFDIIVNRELMVALRSYIFKLVLSIFVLLFIGLLKLPQNISFIISAIIKSLIVLSTLGLILKVIKLILITIANNPKMDKDDEESVQIIQKTTLPLFENMVFIFLTIGGIYEVFAIWNVDMTALLAGAGIGAMAIGMAAKDTLSDMIAGILILSGAPYRVGDIVYVRENLKGRVTQIGLRNTRLITRNNVEVIVPNTIMGTSQIINESSSKEMKGVRFRIDISTGAEEDVKMVKRLLIEAAKESKFVSKDNYIESCMTGFEEDVLHFKVQCWVDEPENKGYAKGELIENIYLKLKESGVDVTMAKEQMATISIKELPSQELQITKFPDTKHTVNINEMPDLFGVSTPKKIKKTIKTVSLDKTILRGRKSNDEK